MPNPGGRTKPLGDAKQPLDKVVREKKSVQATQQAAKSLKKIADKPLNKIWKG